MGLELINIFNSLKSVDPPYVEKRHQVPGVSLKAFPFNIERQAERFSPPTLVTQLSANSPKVALLFARYSWQAGEKNAAFIFRQTSSGLE